MRIIVDRASVGVVVVVIGVLGFLEVTEQTLLQVLFAVEQLLHSGRTAVIRHSQALGLVGARDCADAEDGIEA